MQLQPAYQITSPARGHPPPFAPTLRLTNFSCCADAEAFEDDEEDDEDEDADGEDTANGSTAPMSSTAAQEHQRSFHDAQAPQHSNLSTVPEDADSMDADQTDADGATEAEEAPVPHTELPDASVWTARYHNDAVMAVAWSPDGAQLASGGCDDVAYLHRWQQSGALLPSALLLSYNAPSSCDAIGGSVRGPAAYIPNASLS